MPTGMKTDFNFYTHVVKALMDWCVSLVFLVILSPFLLIIILILAFHFQGNPFFYQERIGKDNEPFRLIKFRTYRLADNPESKSKFGSLLRILRIDELPQLINVIKGEMSFVGPRPLLPEYLSSYTKEESKRHLVKPGITGLSQVKIGNTSDWSNRLQQDVEYVKRQSFGLDIWILMATVGVLFNFGRSRKQEGEIEKFDDFASRR